MKTNLIKTMMIVFSSVMLLGCGSNGDDPTPLTEQEIMMEAIARTWNIAESGVTLDGSLVSEDWAGFSLKINADQTYTATVSGDEQPLIWPASGSFTFPIPSNPNVIMRHDNVQMTLEDVESGSAKIIFRITERNDGGRLDGLLGEWVFNVSN